jgi:hypothetical protein
MSADSTVVGPRRDTAGPVSLVQGVYGARGNLELVACDTRDGLWVFWFNADAADDPVGSPDVLPGSWSGGLDFAAGARYVDAVILQSTLGPDHLEVLALTDAGVLESWYWSPGPGFQRRQADAAAGVTRFAASHDLGTLTAVVETGAGARRIVSGPTGYPERAWTDAGPAASLPRDDAAQEALIAAGVDPATVEPGTARRAVSTRHGGTAELAWRDTAGRIHHLPLPL